VLGGMLCACRRHLWLHLSPVTAQACGLPLLLLLLLLLGSMLLSLLAVWQPVRLCSSISSLCSSRMRSFCLSS
jgi:hypothetical protein